MLASEIEAWIKENKITQLPDAPIKPKPKNTTVKKQTPWRYNTRETTPTVLELIDLILRDFEHSNELYFTNYDLFYSIDEIKQAFTHLRRDLKLKQIKRNRQVIGYRQPDSN